jgi:hypothetical protein
MKTLEKIIFCNNPMCSWNKTCLRFDKDSENRYVFGLGLNGCLNYISNKLNKLKKR